MNRSNAEVRASDRQAKFIQDRISKVEDHFGEFCTHIAAYNRKLCKVRNKGDDVAHAVRTYAESESFNPTAKAALLEFAETFSTVQDYRNTEVMRMEDKVVGPLTAYGTSCKLARERLRSAFAARDKELKQLKNLDKVKERNPSNRQQITMAETELKMASIDASRTSRTLESEMDAFERKKLEDLKKILMDMVNVEMIFHAKALELFTQCYQGLADISEEADLEEFRNSMKPPHAQTRLNMVRTHSKTSLNNTGNTMQSTTSGNTGSNRPTPNTAKRGIPVPRPRGRTPDPGSTQQSNNSGRSQAVTEYDDSDEDSDDDDDLDDDDDDEEEDYDEKMTYQEYTRRMRKT